MIRRTWRRGEHLLIDDESGRTIVASEAIRLWDGSIRHYSSYEPAHPQWFFKARKDPKPLTEIVPEFPTSAAANIIPLTVGDTNVLTKVGAALGKFSIGVLGNDPGIGEMVVGASSASNPFFIRYS